MPEFTTQDNLNFLIEIPKMSVEEICNLPEETLQYLVELASCTQDGCVEASNFRKFFPTDIINLLHVPALRYRWLPGQQSGWYLPETSATVDDKVLYIKCVLLPCFSASLMRAMFMGMYPTYRAAVAAAVTPATRFIEHVEQLFCRRCQDQQILQDMISECENHELQKSLDGLISDCIGFDFYEQPPDATPLPASQESLASLNRLFKASNSCAV